ncbi:MAG: serine hydrolase domain-containing protein [Chlamydiota bacterium]
MTNIHFQFEKDHQTYKIELKPSEVWSPNEVFVDGRRYLLSGDPDQLRWLIEQIPQFSKHENVPLSDLKLRLITVGAHDISVSEKAHEIGVAALLPQARQAEAHHQRLEEITTQRLALQKQLKEAQKAHPELIEILKTEVKEAKKAEMNAYLQYMEVKKHFKGVVLVKDGGKELLRAVYGQRSGLTTQDIKPNTLATRFCIGSMGKMLTASAIMLLEQEGQLSLAEEINRYLPLEFQHKLWKGITIRHLLMHTSGIPLYGSMEQDDLRTRPFTVQDLFEITLILLYTEKNHLKWEDEINTYLPREYQQSRWNGISVLNVLTHETGREDMQSNTLYQRVDELYRFMTTHVKEIGGGLLFAPGTGWSYCNSGYVLLGQIIKNLRHEVSYETYMKKLFESLGMVKTGFDYDIHSDARGFWEKDPSLFVLAEHMQIHASKANAAGGSIFSTLEDMERLDQALYNPNFLTQTTRTKMFTASLPQYPREGLGFAIRENKFVGHPGANHGFNSFMERNIETRDLFIVLGNIALETVSAKEIAEHLEDIFYS